jgi:hypothetical protein
MATVEVFWIGIVVSDQDEIITEHRGGVIARRSIAQVRRALPENVNLR